MTETSISVKQLNLYVKSLLENDVRLNTVSVTGEISDFKNHYASGHWYFTLKDGEAAVGCVMFRGSAQTVGFVPEDGNKVTVRGRVSLYERDGRYQFYVSSLVLAGEGDISLKFKAVAEKLRKEGFFDEASKRAVAMFPRRIAVLTSASGAAVKDICTTLEKRLPSCEVVICPVTVQGEGAARSMINALDRVYRLPGVDTVIIGRGGGSSEDLSAFNDEALARKLHASPVPVISAVGHEVDVTICDFVADKRAATPTAAAVIASADAAEFSDYIYKLNIRLDNAVSSVVRDREYRLNAANTAGLAKRALDLIDRRLQTVDYCFRDLSNAASRATGKAEKDFDALLARLDSLSPLKTLKRGYAAVSRRGKAVTSVEGLREGDRLSLRLYDGNIDCEVKKNEEL